MAIELTTTNLEEIRAKAEELLGLSENCENLEEQKKINDDLDTVIAYYTATSKAACYKAAKESGDAMKYAVTEFFFPIIRINETKDNETGAVFRSIADSVRPIDLGDLHKKLQGIGADPKWIHAAERFNYHLTLRAAQRVGAKVKSDAFAMSDIAKQIDMGKNPCSNNQMLKTLQGIITMMLGEGYKATSHDVNYLVDCYASDSKKSKTAITAANHKTLRNYLKKVCYRILTNGNGYTVDQKEIKNK